MMKTNTPRYILWLGMLVSEEEISLNTALSPAADRWQRKLILAINSKGMDVVLLSHMPQRIWPLGRLCPTQHCQVADEFMSVWGSYWNLPLLKTASISKSLKRKYRELVACRGLPEAVVSYNPTRENIEVGSYIQQQAGVRWIDLCADAYDPGPGWSEYPRGADSAWGHVFLSFHAFTACPFARKLHLDGGIEPAKIESGDRGMTKAILYTGMMSKWGGVELLLAAFGRIDDTAVELWICGQGENSHLTRAIKGDRRIKHYGLVSESRLDELSCRASVFVNPRPSMVEGNNMNFPSKLLHYLGYGKPVVSTWTAGLSEEYREVLFVSEQEDAETLAQTIERALRLEESELARYNDRVMSFARNTKNWDGQAERLLSWLKRQT
jgi:glycosyltransferase involved in cell wall biosynthesis